MNKLQINQEDLDFLKESYKDNPKTYEFFDKLTVEKYNEILDKYGDRIMNFVKTNSLDLKDIDNEKGVLRVGHINPDPIENAPEYEIKDFNDMLKVLTSKNIDFFLKDFEGVLKNAILLKELSQEFDPDAELPTFDKFTWIEDYK